jgi:hypothetical protein
MEPWLPETPPRRKGDIILSFFRFLPFSEFTELIAADKPLSKISTALQTCQFTLFIPPALYFDRLAYSPNPAGPLSLPSCATPAFPRIPERLLNRLYRLFRILGMDRSSEVTNEFSRDTRAEREVGNESKSPQTHEVRVARRLLAVGRMPERTVGACKIRRASGFLPSQISKPQLPNSAGQRH